MGVSTGTRAKRLQPSLARLPPLTSLRAFVATARHLSFMRAADELHVTSTAVGQQIRLLEDHLGVTLFDRDRGQLHLTAAGRALMPGLTEAFEVVVESVSQVASYPDDSPIRVSVAPSFASKWLIPRLDGLREAVPGMDVLVDASARLADLASEDVDCVIRYGPGGYPGLVTERLFSEAVLPVCSPEFARDHQLHRGPEALRGVPILHEEGPEHDTSCPDWKGWLRAQGLSSRLVKGGIRLSLSSLVLDAAVAGKGIGLGKLRLAEGDLASGRLVSPFGTPHSVEFSYFFATTPHKEKLAAVEHFRNWLRAEALRSGGLDLPPQLPHQQTRLSIVAAE
ncbi:MULTISPECIES: transcriptional regulator GcvA [unclassified Mesorhizobium]|uniref:transcriptional regulator GcvA n=1 Tax=unclassified Mesorhizobium TaxID=325217 RepID=UPI000FCB67B9|nr:MULTISPECIES: transcriptional regulator GcvA [unclassified Mesorhizobium]RUW30389.1 transcriptional regulator GcvA [Mesorhizobium sp. M1E.F.Ca.ET.041.01.1.1]RWD91850.1 MAG: transcriptional regulator GcvA [Mesorhizobium sp.]RWD95793.1 MAG: transcriptional regulator GcvA [Mesorhizobium sp.]TIV50479.1 MAG: transcriptional regulator GcvA [Mesorhizobium sp.]TKB16493.1 MAG: transcriptional regulator GcvA [Mesorhizobium sp.]